jgi:hypothetical protein
MDDAFERPSDQTFRTWLERPREVVEDDFDGEMREPRERAVPGQPVTDDLTAVHLATC